MIIRIISAIINTRKDCHKPFVITPDNNLITFHEANVYLLEKQILDLEESSESYMTMVGNTTGDTQKYMEAIEENFKIISVLRQKLELARQKADACSEANQELARIEKILSEEIISFDVFDDIVIRRLVECIRVMKDRKIVVILKGGLQAEESF